jgi:hypothetical protein
LGSEATSGSWFGAGSGDAVTIPSCTSERALADGHGIHVKYRLRVPLQGKIPDAARALQTVVQAGVTTCLVHGTASGLRLLAARLAGCRS